MTTQTLHRAYLKNSPLYRNLISQYGQWVPEYVAARALRDHGDSLSDAETELSWDDQGRVSALSLLLYLGY